MDKRKNQTSIPAKNRFSRKCERGDPAPGPPDLSKLFSQVKPLSGCTEEPQHLLCCCDDLPTLGLGSGEQMGSLAVGTGGQHSRSLTP